MLIVHHLGISQSDRIVWLCEELGLPYELRRYDRDPVSRLAPADYKALSPFGTAPVIEDGDLVLGESGAIIDYILARHGDGGLRPAPDQADFADYLFWFHFANASMMPAAMADMMAQMVPDSATIDIFRARGHRAFEMVEARLATVPWFAGDAFTAADIVMLFPLTTMRMFVPRDIGAMPALRAYLQRIGERPAFRRAMSKAEPGMEPLLA